MELQALSSDAVNRSFSGKNSGTPPFFSAFRRVLFFFCLTK
ncbi:hypothetical protein T260_08420 [Geobacillus thermopakistaniensis]|uniref:Uncharacterized protein n=1 Tax=Geobacillus thermopakistaniensis (strain MAS1) TaxID=1408282 RepID=A0A7U9JBI8_GEOTM|nr:hypothetical protein T260_08420 [Geobacillus sp. MAS1]